MTRDEKLPPEIMAIIQEGRRHPERRVRYRRRVARDITPQERHEIHVAMGDVGRCDESCTHEPYPPCPVCGEPA